MDTNMTYRQYLVNNANTIIDNNLNIAAGNCSNIQPLMGSKMPAAPVLFKSILENPLVYQQPSDLQDNFLNNYIASARASSSGFQY